MSAPIPVFAHMVRYCVLVGLCLWGGLWGAPIHQAAAKGDLAQLRVLLEGDPVLLEARDEDGNTPLRSACAAGQEAAVDFLLGRGAKVNVRNNWGSTPLHSASGARNKGSRLAELLLDRGADINVRTDQALTALHTAAIAGNLPAVELLLKKGIDPNVVDKGSYGTALHVAIKVSSNEAMAVLLVDHGAKLLSDSFGNTELHLAAMKGYAQLARALLRHGAELNAPNKKGETALYHAAIRGYKGVAQLLLKAGANPADEAGAKYGPAPQLREATKEGEAWLWYLGGYYGGGFALKSHGHLLVFDKSALGLGEESGLANGQLNPVELEGQNLLALITKIKGARFEKGAFGLAEKMPGVKWILDEVPPEGVSAPVNGQIAAPGELIKKEGIEVLPFAVMGKGNGGAVGLGYLVEVDGLRIVHAGFHMTSNKSVQLEKYRKTVDALAERGSIDLVFLSVKAHLSGSYEPYLYLLERLKPKAIYLMGGDIVSEEYSKCAAVLNTKGIPVFFPEGALPQGQRFHYQSGPRK